MNRFLLLLLMVGFLVLHPPAAAAQETVRSPDGDVKITFQLNENGAPTYAVTYQGEQVVYPSTLGLDFSDRSALSDSLRVTKTERSRANTTYRLAVGASRKAEAHYKQLTVHLREQSAPERKLRLVFRAYPEGAAFRYELPRQPNLDHFSISNEKSTFVLPGVGTAWPLRLKSFRTNYEGFYLPAPTIDIGPDDLVGLPLTVEIAQGPTIALTEAGLTDYAGMYLRGKYSDNPLHTLTTALSPLPDDSSVAVRGETPLSSPWRAVMIGDTPGDLIESNLLLHLNKPLAVEDTSWIHAGKTAWHWWSGNYVDDPDIEGGMNTATMKYYIDFAAEHGLEYALIDAEWYGDHHDPAHTDITTTIPEIDMPEILRYARQRDVGIVLWLNWKNVQRQMKEAFPLYQKWGVAGVKIDYMNRDDQAMVNFYHRTVKEAAAHELTVNFHGAYKPTGLRRTYPNLLTREGVMGNEYSKWSEHITPEHDVTLPFTRMLAGPMDFTPGGFDNRLRKNFEARYENPTVMGTRAHQLAMYVVYESPEQMVSDHPSAYAGEPATAFLEEVPARWDATRVLAGDIGDDVAIARKHGDDWFIGAMTDWSARTLSLPLDFLEAGRTYKATIYEDGAPETPKDVHIRTVPDVQASDQLEAEMSSGGGYVVHLTPAR